MRRNVLRVALLALFALFALFALAPRLAHAEDASKVGSKRFVESYILAEIITQLAHTEGLAMSHELGLGGTAVVFRALEDGAIQAYPEYTGTLAEVALKTPSAKIPELRQALAPRGYAVSDSLGFENTYALAVRRDTAERLRLTSISDLVAHPELRVGLSHEFMGRNDGWGGLRARYGLKPNDVSALDHALAYEALATDKLDVVDVYTTDAKIARYNLVVLADDLHFFPPYDAVIVYRTEFAASHPAFVRVLARLQGAIDAPLMRQLNARAELDNVPFARVAGDWLAARRDGGPVALPSTARASRPGLFRGTLDATIAHGPRHLWLVLVSLLVSTCLGVPLGILAYGSKRLGAFIVGTTGVIQTIPSLALFCFFIPLLGIGPVPALVALSLYGLLPIVRNTHAGLASIPADLREAAIAIGLSRAERLRHVELPLASRTILAGVKTSAVVAVGSATIAAFIGAGGFGEPISTGLSLNDVPMILQGAIPAALLALGVQGLFALIEHRVQFVFRT